MNCWEYMKCGREEGGVNASTQGVCSAYPQWGKRCARIAGSLNGEFITGTIAQEIPNCAHCEFYRSEHYVQGRPKELCGTT